MTKRKIDAFEIPYYAEVVIKTKPEFISKWEKQEDEFNRKIFRMEYDHSKQKISYMRTFIDLLLEILNILNTEMEDSTRDKIGNGVEYRKNRIEMILSYFNRGHYGIVEYLIYENEFMPNIVMNQWPRKTAHDKYCSNLNEILGKVGKMLTDDVKRYYGILSGDDVHYEAIRPITASLYVMKCMSREIIEYILFFLIVFPKKKTLKSLVRYLK